MATVRLCPCCPELGVARLRAGKESPLGGKDLKIIEEMRSSATVRVRELKVGTQRNICCTWQSRKIDRDRVWIYAVVVMNSDSDAQVGVDDSINSGKVSSPVVTQVTHWTVQHRFLNHSRAVPVTACDVSLTGVVENV